MILNLNADEIEIDVEYCGICHSDLYVLKNKWGITKYPFVPVHKVIGEISAEGDMVKHLQIRQYFGLV